MSETVIVAILSLVGTLGGSLFGILAANKLMAYRLQQLEEKVNKHNNLIERTFKLEEKETLLEEKVRVANHRIDDLEKYHK
jgi:hypothetical protein